MARKILIADDEPGVAALLRDYFEMNGWLVISAKDGEEAIRGAEREPDIILLDVTMPRFDGMEVCRRIRDYVSCPIIFLTARTEDYDKVAGFISGGDDYVTKPFSIEELGARVEAHLRREARRAGSARVRFEDNLVIDYSARTASVNGTEIPLAKKEFEIVSFLSANRGQVYDKERIYERLWGYDAEGDSSVVTEYVKRVRAKFKQAGAGERIETLWGVGYKWR